MSRVCSLIKAKLLLQMVIQSHVVVIKDVLDNSGTQKKIFLILSSSNALTNNVKTQRWSEIYQELW